jgi:hypothetical protein
MAANKAASTVEPHTVVEELVAAIDGRLATAPPGLHRDDLLVDAWAKLGREVPALEIAAGALVRSYDMSARAQGRTQQVANVVRGQVGSLLQVADRGSVEFTQAGDLLAAEAEVERVEQACRDAMAALQAAVEAAESRKCYAFGRRPRSSLPSSARPSSCFVTSAP